MNKKITVYVRDNEYNPKGVVSMKKTDIQFKNSEDVHIPIIAVGWSKAHKNDVFIKKFGRRVAERRVDKTIKSLINTFDIIDVKNSTHINNVPYIINDSIEACFDTAKKVYHIEDECIFVVPSITHDEITTPEDLNEVIKHLEDVVSGKNMKRQVTTYNFIKY